MAIISKLIRKLASSGPVYVKIKPDLLSVTDVSTGKHFEDMPLIAIKDGDIKTIIAVGRLAENPTAQGQNITVLNGFKHPRTIINDFIAAEMTLKFFLKKITENTIIKPAPVMIIHPLDKLDGGLTVIEKRALRELGAGVGAREVYIWCGRPLSNSEIKNSNIKEDGCDGDISR